MVKNVSQTSVKISKKEQDFNKLLSLKRPSYRVYITDSSSFMSLVQDLTGNKTSYNAVLTTSSPYPRQQQHAIPVVDVEEYQRLEPQRSTTTSSSSLSVSNDDVSFDSWNQEIFMNDQELDQLCYQMYNDDFTTTETGSLEGASPPSTADQMVDLLPIQDLESWILETEAFDVFNIHGYGQIDQADSTFDYDISGLL